MVLRVNAVHSNSAPRTQQFIEDLVASHAQAPVQWSEPTHFDLSSWADQQEVSRRFADGRLQESVDRVNEIADDLFEMRHPDLKSDNRARQEFIGDITSQGAGFGNWVAFDWSRELVRYPEQQDYQDLRTFRNKNLITASEQTKLLDATIAVFGLSVGSKVVKELVIGGIGGKLVLGDFDKLTPSNLNRIEASMAEVGMRKVDIAAIKASKADPYIEQVHFHEGVTRENLEQLEGLQPAIVFDEIDDLAGKALLRQFAAKQRVPLIMATDSGDTPLIDVERYDLGTGVPFNGRLNEREIDQLLEGGLSPEQQQKMKTKIVGLRYVSPRLLDSVMEIRKTLGGIPQLSTTANTAGSLSAISAREILLGRKLDSGRYAHSPKKTLRLESQMGPSDSIRTVHRFIKNKPQ